MLIEQRYLHFPVKNGAAAVRMKVTVGDTIVDDFDIELAPAAPSFWAFLDMEKYQGQQATIEVDRLPSDSQGLAQVRQQTEIPGAATLYQEKYRPQFHFSPCIGWNNDPNGLVFYQGEWHLYFQHNPYGWNWGNMHWGHAVSADLVHWTQLPIAIYPYKFGDWVFSGGAVVDKDNTAGFKSGPKTLSSPRTRARDVVKPLPTRTIGGRTFTDYEGNPVVKNQGRDPKIIWYGPGKHWVMAVYDEEGTGDQQKRRIAFYSFHQSEGVDAAKQTRRVF